MSPGCRLQPLSRYRSRAPAYKDVGYDALRDLVPVAVLTTAASLMVVSNASPYRDARELLAASRFARDKLRFARAASVQVDFGVPILAVA